MAAVEPGPAPVSQPWDRRRLPAETDIYTPFIWVMVFAPLISSALLFTWHPSLRLEHIGGPTGPETLNPASMFSAGYFLVVGSGLLVYAALAVLAWLDQKALQARGVDRPFAWGWAFLGGIVYVIGRSVIVHRVSGNRGLAPIWAIIAVTVVGFAVSGIWEAEFFGTLTHSLAHISG